MPENVSEALLELTYGSEYIKENRNCKIRYKWYKK